MIYRLLEVAERELREAVAFYESAEPGLGIELLDEVERTIGPILKHPRAWACPKSIEGVGCVASPLG